jgi:hypothetical protein
VNVSEQVDAVGNRPERLKHNFGIGKNPKGGGRDAQLKNKQTSALLLILGSSV